MKVGDTVQILRKDIKPLEHRKQPVKGKITYINGANLLVRPHWCKWEAHLYTNEVKVVN